MVSDRTVAKTEIIFILIHTIRCRRRCSVICKCACEESLLVCSAAIARAKS